MIHDLDHHGSHHGILEFDLGSTRLGIPIWLVREVTRLGDLTPVCGTGPHVVGLTNLRGQVTTVLDPCARLGLCGGNEEGSQLLVLKSNAEIGALGPLGQLGLETSDEVIAWRVSRVHDVRHPPESAFGSQPPHLDAGSRDYLLGVYQLEDQVIGIANAQKLCAA